MSVIVELSIFPMDKQGSFAPFVARVVSIIRASGLPHTLGPMGTCIEGSWEAVMKVTDQCFRELQQDSDRVYMTMKVDWRRNRTNGLSGKVQSVNEELGS